MKMIQAIFGVICAIFFLAIGGLQAAEMPASEIIKQSWEKFRSGGVSGISSNFL